MKIEEQFWTMKRLKALSKFFEPLLDGKEVRVQETVDFLEAMGLKLVIREKKKVQNG